MNETTKRVLRIQAEELDQLSRLLRAAANARTLHDADEWLSKAQDKCDQMHLSDTICALARLLMEARQ
jgi:hypothetical protein